VASKKGQNDRKVKERKTKSSKKSLLSQTKIRMKKVASYKHKRKNVRKVKERRTKSSKKSLLSQQKIRMMIPYSARKKTRKRPTLK
jgi:hypothetical protein